LRLKERISVATFNGRQGKESFAQKIFSGEEVERLVESIEKGDDTEQQRDRRTITPIPWDDSTSREEKVRLAAEVWKRWMEERVRQRQRQRSTTPSSLPRCSDRGDSMSMYCRED